MIKSIEWLFNNNDINLNLYATAVHVIYLRACQLLLKSQTRYFSAGTIICDSREKADGIFVITSGQVYLCAMIARSITEYFLVTF